MSVSEVFRFIRGQIEILPGTVASGSISSFIKLSGKLWMWTSSFPNIQEWQAAPTEQFASNLCTWQLRQQPSELFRLDKGTLSQNVINLETTPCIKQSESLIWPPQSDTRSSFQVTVLHDFLSLKGDIKLKSIAENIWRGLNCSV